MSFHNLLEQFYNNIFIFNNTKILVLFDKNNTIWMSYNSILKALGYNDIKKFGVQFYDNKGTSVSYE